MTTYPQHWPVDSDWTKELETEFASDWFKELSSFVESERKQSVIYPPAEDTFNAFRWTSFADTRVVILGQDPYHGSGQAHGLCFSVADSVTKLPPSLKNIYKELSADLSCEIPATGNLSSWAKQGVLLINTVLTVRESEANSHKKKGWEKFTDAVIRRIGEREESCVFILWGKPAESKMPLIGSQHKIIASPHPSPLSARRGFFDSKPFSQANAALEAFGFSPIQWDSILEN